MHDVQDAHVLVESLLSLAAAVGEGPSISSVGLTLRLFNGTFNQRMQAVEDLLDKHQPKAPGPRR